MNNSKLLKLILIFKIEDWRRFKEFVASPYFNKKKELIEFTNYLRSLYPSLSWSSI